MFNGFIKNRHYKIFFEQRGEFFPEWPICIKNINNCLAGVQNSSMVFVANLCADL